MIYLQYYIHTISFNANHVKYSKENYHYWNGQQYFGKIWLSGIYFEYKLKYNLSYENDDLHIISGIYNIASIFVYIIIWN